MTTLNKAESAHVKLISNSLLATINNVEEGGEKAILAGLEEYVAAEPELPKYVRDAVFNLLLDEMFKSGYRGNKQSADDWLYNTACNIRDRLQEEAQPRDEPSPTAAPQRAPASQPRHTPPPPKAAQPKPIAPPPAPVSSTEATEQPAAVTPEVIASAFTEKVDVPVVANQLVERMANQEDAHELLALIEPHMVAYYIRGGAKGKAPKHSAKRWRDGAENRLNKLQRAS